MAHVANAASEMTESLHAFRTLSRVRLAHDARFVPSARYTDFMQQQTVLNRLRFRLGLFWTELPMNLLSWKDAAEPARVLLFTLSLSQEFAAPNVRVRTLASAARPMSVSSRRPGACEFPEQRRDLPAIAQAVLAEMRHQIALFQPDTDKDVAGRHHRKEQVTHDHLRRRASHGSLRLSDCRSSAGCGFG
jgi:hypothetical protein